jgi:hypothetical protein
MLVVRATPTKSVARSGPGHRTRMEPIHSQASAPNRPPSSARRSARTFGRIRGLQICGFTGKSEKRGRHKRLQRLVTVRSHYSWQLSQSIWHPTD